MKNPETMKQVNPHSNCGDCFACGGSRWGVIREKTDFYGMDMILDFAILCKYAGEMRNKDITGVPAMYHDADYSKFGFGEYTVDMGKFRKITDNFLNQYEVWQKNGKGLYLWSRTPGSGKTFLACCLAKSVMIRRNIQMRFITAPEYIATVMESYKRERGSEDKSQVYRECDLLVLDDIGAQKEGAWQEQELFSLINKRTENGLVTIYTSNSKPEDLGMNARTVDRIISGSLTLQMPEESIRRKKAQKEQQDFSKAVGLY